MLVFAHPGCGPCSVIAGELPRWQQRRAGVLDIAVIGSGGLDDNRNWADQHGLPWLLVQKTNEVGARYRLRSIPSAVLITPGGRIADPAAIGPEPVRHLLATAHTV